MIRKILLVLSLLLALLACSGDPRAAGEKLIETGDRYFENGKYKEASIIYRRAIQKDRLFGQAYYKLGLAEQRLGRFRQALGALTRAVELSPENQDAYGKLADLYLAIYLNNPVKYERFLADLQRITEVGEQHFPDAFDINRVKGFVALSAKEYPDAVEFFQRANEQQPDDRRVALGYVQSLAADGRQEKALELANAFIEGDKSFGGMYDFVYMQKVRTRDFDGALEGLKGKIESNPDNLLYRLQLARHYLFAEKPEEMREVLGELTANTDRYPQAWSAVGEFYLRIRDFDRALNTFETGAEQDEAKAADYRNKIVEVLAMQGRYDEAFRIVNETLEDSPENPSALALRGAIRLRSGDRAEIESATNDFEAALARKPDNAVLRYNLAEAYRAQGNVDRSLVEYETSIRNRPDYLPPRYRLASLQIEQGEYAKAAATAEEILEHSPNDARAEMLRANAWIRMGQIQQARVSLEELVKKNPQFRDPKVELARVYLRDRQFSDAERLFRELSEMSPPDARGLLGLADVYVLQGQPRKAEALLLKQIEAAPDSLSLRIALGSTYLVSGRYDEAIKILKEAEAQRPDDGQLVRLLGSVYYTKGDTAEARRYLSRATELIPNDPTPVLYLGMLAERQGSIQQAADRYEKVIQMASDNVVALNNLAYILAETTGDLDRALTLVQKARGLAPSDPNIADTLGYIYIKKKLPGSALPVLEDVVRTNPNIVIWRYHLALALYQSGNASGAREHLQTALRNKPSEEEKFKIEELLSQIGS